MHTYIHTFNFMGYSIIHLKLPYKIWFCYNIVCNVKGKQGQRRDWRDGKRLKVKKGVGKEKEGRGFSHDFESHTSGRRGWEIGMNGEEPLWLADRLAPHLVDSQPERQRVKECWTHSYLSIHERMWLKPVSVWREHWFP